MTAQSVDPARLRWGTWCHRTEKITGEGDLAASSVWCAEHVRQLGGESPLDNLMEEKSWLSAKPFRRRSVHCATEWTLTDDDPVGLPPRS